MKNLLLRQKTIWAETFRLSRIQKKSNFNINQAGRINESEIRTWLNDNSAIQAWQSYLADQSLQNRSFDNSGGVNPGDRQALFALVYGSAAKKVLEVGTHVGSSTSAIAAALKMGEVSESYLDTVDLVDVNSSDGPWHKSGLPFSPGENLKQLGLAEYVHFHAMPALEYMANTSEKYDIIFLDGDHSAKAVYQEIPAAFDLLNKNGMVILHDFFPQGQPLWPDGKSIPGPFLGVRRLQKEGIAIGCLPLGELPWPTKQGTNVTSLAVVGKA